MVTQARKPSPPDADKRWKIVDVAMRRNGYAGHALIETLHVVQDCFGYLDDPALVYVGRCLHLPVSKVYGVATFYHLFTMKPQGKHSCVVCTGTACYIKGARELLEGLHDRFGIQPGETTADRQLSVLSARCLGACGLAPAAVVDGQVLGKLGAEKLVARLEGLS
jgi:bidirectional [NiFe] hydrogenase diaphorase subunit